MEEINMTGLEIAGVVLLCVSLVGNGALGTMALSKDNSDKVVKEAMAPYMEELSNVKSLIDPKRTPFCDEKSDKYDGFTCVTLELCSKATGSDLEVTSDCKSFANVLITEEIVRQSVAYADKHWPKYGEDETDAWKKAKDDFEDMWEKRKGG